MMPTASQQAAQTKAEIEQDEFIQDQANPKLSPDVEADLEEAQKDYQMKFAVKHWTWNAKPGMLITGR